MAEHVCLHEGEIAKMAEAIKNLRNWQEKQNGTIGKVEAKIDKLIWWIMAEFAGVVALLLTILLQRR